MTVRAIRTTPICVAYVRNNESNDFLIDLDTKLLSRIMLISPLLVLTRSPKAISFELRDNVRRLGL
jgi:hypothetical protein